MMPEAEQKIQLVLVIAIAVAALRAGYVVYERHNERTEQATKQVPPLNPDYYVVPKKLYPFDLKSAKQLTQQPVWVKEGYRFTYYPMIARATTLISPAKRACCCLSKGWRSKTWSPTLSRRICSRQWRYCSNRKKFTANGKDRRTATVTRSPPTRCSLSRTRASCISTGRRMF